MSLVESLRTERTRLPQDLIHWGILIIVAIMPFHAFLSVYLGSLIGHQQIIQAWKEVLIVGLGVLAMICMIGYPVLRRSLMRPVNFAVAGFVAVSLLTSLVHSGTTQSSFWFGAKTDLEFLVIFVITQLASRSRLEDRLIKIMLASASLVAFIGTLQTTVLDKNFLAHFGYGPTTLLPYLLVDPAVPKDIRVLSTLAGPNQLGSFLILPICLMLYLIIKRRYYILLLPLAASLFTLLHSFSRSAWIGAIIAMTLTLAFSLPRKISIILAAVGVIGFIILLTQSRGLLHKYPKLQYFVLHSQTTNSPFQSSNQGHLKSLGQGITQATSHPGGLGLGSAGPATYHSSKPLITENFYLQLAIETGFIGLFLFLIINFLLFLELLKLPAISLLAVPSLAALVGLAVVNLLLHTWADSATALVFWSVAGATVASRIGQPKHV